ncbi:hypothetical protein BDV98DRAFT_570469 [Pterulicium gracile]|uniref:Uncharacterized protein n=1 Tax=Pterulicium gracile TaxID=1884261 RepID=A0A5C3QD29_9AGAR|nr:hypothetical protein BDV98DRAFT_570469 [Pterula gracilis]
MVRPPPRAAPTYIALFGLSPSPSEEEAALLNGVKYDDIGVSGISPSLPFPSNAESSFHLRPAPAPRSTWTLGRAASDRLVLNRR